jgi:uncharacterized membrane protein YgaE (UPF0421/DUF939 family)
MKSFNKKQLILPVLLAVIAFIAVPYMSSEIDGYGTFFLVAVAIGLGFMINQFIFKKKDADSKKLQDLTIGLLF